MEFVVRLYESKTLTKFLVERRGNRGSIMLSDAKGPGDLYGGFMFLLEHNWFLRTKLPHHLLD
jgi:hypothetical protein